MRALRRITTPVTVAALAGCSFPVDQLRVEPEPSDAAALTRDGGPDGASGEGDAVSSDAENDVGDAATTLEDAAVDACTCVEFNPGGKCKKWEPPGCG